MKKQQKMKLDDRKWTKVYLHKVGYNGLTKRLTLPIGWCVRNGIEQYDKLVIVEEMRCLRVMTEHEFKRLYPNMAIDEVDDARSPIRW